MTEEQRQILERMGIPGSDRAVVLEALPSLLATVDLVLDALVGYRWQGVPREPIASLIYAANRASVPRLALDMKGVRIDCPVTLFVTKLICDPIVTSKSTIVPSL